MKTLLRLAIGVLLASGAGLPAPAFADPLPGIVSQKPGSSACFRRDYDAAHLARLPRQMTLSVLFSIKYEAPGGGGYVERIEMRRKDRADPLRILGTCSWSEKANIDTSGNRMLKEFRKAAGYDCLVSIAPGSAEEGGYFIVDLAPDGKTVTLYLDSPIALWSDSHKRDAGQLDLGADDRVFRLHRTDAAACTALEAALDGP